MRDQPAPAAQERAPVQPAKPAAAAVDALRRERRGLDAAEYTGLPLSDELGIQLRRVGSGARRTFVEGEQGLSAWMADNAFVSWVVREHPWELEDNLIASP